MFISFFFDLTGRFFGRRLGCNLTPVEDPVCSEAEAGNTAGKGDPPDHPSGVNQSRTLWT
jgi:hypothetical protein